METTGNEVAEDIYRISTGDPGCFGTGFTFNQFLIDADEPVLFSTGFPVLIPRVAEAVDRVLPRRRAFGSAQGTPPDPTSLARSTNPRERYSLGGRGVRRAGGALRLASDQLGRARRRPAGIRHPLVLRHAGQLAGRRRVAHRHRGVLSASALRHDRSLQGGGTTGRLTPGGNALLRRAAVNGEEEQR